MIVNSYTDLGIVSTKKPFNTHLWWEHTTYGITMVDSTNQAVLLHSTKARLLVDGSDWSVIDLSDNVNSYKIQAGWLVGFDLFLVMCDNPGNEYEVCYIQLNDSNDCNPIGVSAGADAGTVHAYDIFNIAADMFVINHEEQAAQGMYVVREVDTAPFNEEDTDNALKKDIGYGVVIGTKYYVQRNGINIMEYDDATSTIDPGSSHANWVNPDNRSQQFITANSDNSLLYYIAKKVSDGLNYLWSYAIIDEATTESALYNVALMLNRNNAGTVPNEVEKGFGISNEIVYEIKPKR